MRRLIDQDKGSQADSEFLLDGIFNMLNGERLEMDSPEDFRFVFEGDRTLQHEFIYKKDFQVASQVGLFFEIFYSPYFAEVLQATVYQNGRDGNSQLNSIFKAR